MKNRFNLDLQHFLFRVSQLCDAVRQLQNYQGSGDTDGSRLKSVYEKIYAALDAVDPKGESER